jgi:CubicO group peptidase (beta-lactamase class C family)
MGIRFCTVWLGIVLGLLVPGCRTPGPTAARPHRGSATNNLPAVYPQFRFVPEKLAELDAVINASVARREIPGAVLWLGHGSANHFKAYGCRSVWPTEETMTSDTIFDAASLTKVLATTPALVKLMEQGRIDLDDPVQRHVPEFRHARITLRHLATHTSGLPPGLTQKTEGYEAAIARACAEKTNAAPGTAFKYSDVNFILLGEVVRRVSGQTLAAYVEQEFYRPLGMRDTGYWPPLEKTDRVAPTERIADGILRGTVHDPTARRMGGVAGHAGVFTTAPDLARYCRMLLNGGELGGVRVLSPDSVRRMTTPQSPRGLAESRGIGWDINSPYAGPRGKVFPVGSYGHTGWTGTSLWIDPASQSFVLLLSNRNHPDGGGSIVSLRSSVGTLAAEACGLRAPAAVPAR